MYLTKTTLVTHFNNITTKFDESMTMADTLTSSNQENFDFFNHYSLLSKERVILSYKGPITNVLLSEFGKDVRQKLQDNKKVSKKVFSIFMEVTQNILFYSKEVNHFGNKDKVGTIVVVELKDHIKILSGNLIIRKSINSLLKKFDAIQSLDREALRAYKRELRDAPSEEESRGAGIGLVQIALVSDEIEASIKNMGDEFAFFALSIKVKS